MSKGKKASRKAKSATKAKTAAKKQSVKTRASSGASDTELREYLAKVLTWGEAHADWKQALAGLDPAQRGVRPAGSPYSAWELLEHARIAQEDIVDFATNPKYRAREWPASYWPNSPAPPDDAAWEKSVKEFAQGTEEMVKLLKDPRTDLFAKIPHGTGQTMLRQALLLADHNSYHLGQLVLVRRLLGAWAPS
ncbi:MAG: DinB family protein [Candidatus Acidiferrales bacterium]